MFGLSPTFGGKPFGFLQYVCLSSALVVLKPEVLFLHHVYEPNGWWWDQFVKRVEQTGGQTTRTDGAVPEWRRGAGEVVEWEGGGKRNAAGASWEASLKANAKPAKKGTELRLVRQRDVTEIFGNPVEHFAHKADVIRLEALRDYGGAYLDTDVLVIKGELLTA